MTRASHNAKLKPIPSIVVSILIIGAVVVSLLQFYSNKNVEIDVKYSFSEIYGVDFIFEKNAEKNINHILDSLKIEDSNFFGFANNINTTIDLYKSNAIINAAKLIPNYNLTSHKQTFLFLSNINIENLDFLNLSYYLELCLNLGIEIDYPKVLNALSRFYDKETDLFFIDHVGNSINHKLIATAMVKRILRDKLSYESFKSEDGIREAYREYNFQTSNDVTLYNSGGDILYSISAFGMEEEIDKEKLNNWFAYWKDFYESSIVDSLMSALQYSEYLNVARVFEPDYSSKKLQDYYTSLTAEDIEKLDDINILYNVIKNVKLLNNTDANNAIELHIDEVISNENLFQSNIDIKSTVYGVLMARKTNFLLNEVKLREYIQHNYTEIPLIENNYDRTSALYYNIFLDQLMNGYYREYDEVYFQSNVDELLESLRYDQAIIADVISARRVVEIIMHLQIFDVDVQLTKTQRAKILKGMKKALEDNTIKNSVLMNDVYIINEALALNLVSDEELIGIYNKLNSNGGFELSKMMRLSRTF